MTIETLKDNATLKEIKIIVEKDEFNKLYDQKLKKLSKTIKLEGFRKGRVPVSIIKKRFGKSIKAEVTEELIDKTSSDYLENLEYIMTSTPQMETFEQNKDGSFYYTLKYEHIPQFDLKEYKNLDIEVETQKFSQEEFDKYLKEQFLPGFSKRVEVEGRDIVEEGDLAIIDIKATSENGEEVKEFTKTDFPLEVGKNIFDGIDEVVKGKKIGDKFDFTYKNSEGNPVTFNIEIKRLEQFKVPELNEEFVAQYFAHGREEYNVEAFLKDLKNEYQAQIDKANQNKLVENYLEKLATEIDFEIPQSVLKEAERIFLENYIANNPSYPKEDKEKLLSENREEINKIARKQVIIIKIKNLENIVATEKEILNFINEFIYRYGMPKEEAAKFLSDKNKYNEIIVLIENKKLEDFIINNNNIKEKENTSEEEK